MFGKQSKNAPEPPPASLRDFALTGELPPRPADAPGSATLAIMDLSAQGGLATVCSFADGATSLYTSTGGGVIGVGNDQRANAVSREFVASVEAARDSLTPADATPDLSPGHVRFLLRVEDQLFGAVCAEADIQRADHPLHHLWLKGQEVLTWIRIVSQERQRG